MQHLETFLLIAEADRVLCHLVMFNCLFPLDVQNEIQLLSRFFCYSWLVCLLGFWLINVTLVKVIGNPILDGSLLLTSRFWLYLTLGLSRGEGGWMPPPSPRKVFLSFFLEDKTSVSDVFSCCLFIPRAHFATGLVMVSCYGYEI